MKRFFTRPPANQPANPAPPTILQPASAGPGLNHYPKYTVPPVPHPCPHEHIAVLATPDGLLLRPHIAGLKHPSGLVRMAWGREGGVQESQEEVTEDWGSSVIIYGIVGVLQLNLGMSVFKCCL